MISKCDNCEYTITVADLMTTLSQLDAFIIYIWIGSGEKPLIFSDADDFKFLQESIKIRTGNGYQYVLYDMITHLEVCFNENK